MQEQAALFWADQKAEEILGRKKFAYIDKPMPKFEKFVVKTSASISGVLHIGRLSDTIRGESVVRALAQRGAAAEFIWVAEDMDPLRKVPEGVPRSYSQYIGMPVTDIPDPLGCHSSYAEHHVSEYMQVINEFVASDLKKYSMREEYKKGSFKPYVKAMLEKIDEVIRIQNRYRQKPLPAGWSPWQPICENCGKIITPRVKEFREGKVLYECKDYQFETTLAKGCGYEGENDPLRGEGKLMWKGEWAAQWAHWRVASEGAGKEYIVPESAFWINSELVERIFDFPSPVPIFYEHLEIDGQKMSASLGNVVYPKDWLSVAQPQLLRFFYNKKLMKTRSFSWRDLPNLYDEYDLHARVYFNEERVENEKEARHMKRLYEISQLKEVAQPLHLPFSHAAMIAQIFEGEEAIIASLKRSGHYEESKRNAILERVALARNWAQKYAPEESKVSLAVNVEKIKSVLSNEQKEFLRRIGTWLAKTLPSAEEIHNQIYATAKELGLPASKAFQAIYLALLAAQRGPKAGAFIASLERAFVVQRFEEVAR